MKLKFVLRSGERETDLVATTDRHDHGRTSPTTCPRTPTARPRSGWTSR